MAHQATLGNLALAEQWPTYSETESKATFTQCSTFAADGAVRNVTAGSIVSLDAQAFAAEGAALEWAALPSITEKVMSYLTYVNETRAFAAEGAALEWVLSSSSKSVRPYLTDVSETRTLDEKATALQVQVCATYDVFHVWPGSYNQLFLSGSLDYCRSAVRKLKGHPVNVQEKIMSEIRRYHRQCSDIARQYHAYKASIRRLDLQSMEDRFELLQQLCADMGVYPRLEDLDLTDIPAE